LFLAVGPAPAAAISSAGSSLRPTRRWQAPR